MPSRLARFIYCWAALGWAAALAEPPAKKEGEAETKPRTHEERVVVSASPATRALLDSPAAVDVVDGEALEQVPADHVGDQLRRVPGINVVQFSARDVNVSSRSASGGISNSTLVVADGRNLYQDFLGFVMWEFAPSDPELVDRMEIVRGPASSVWGANAVGGVVHLLTKSPYDTPGGRVRAAMGNYALWSVEGRQSFRAGAWALRLSGGYSEQKNFARPATITNFLGETINPDLGLIPHDARGAGTQQPRIDLRADRRLANGGEWIVQGGAGRTSGWITTGIGPFQISDRTSNSFAQVRYRRGLVEGQAYFDYFDGDAINLINAIPFGFRSNTMEVSVRGRSLLGRRGVAGWGAEYVRSTYDLSIAPAGSRRNILAMFGEVDVGIVDELRFVAGARIDHYRETIGTAVSPRLALRYSPRPNHTLRIAAGRAFRAPSVVETDLDIPVVPVASIDWEQVDRDIVGFDFFAPLTRVVCQARTDNCGAPPGEIPTYLATIEARGSRRIAEEVTDSIEIGYATSLRGGFNLAVSVYHTRSHSGISFLRKQDYGVGPDGLPLTVDDVPFPTDPDGDGIDEAPADDVCVYVKALQPFDQLCAQGPVGYHEFLTIQLDGNVPSLFQYDNGPEVDNRGVEVGLQWSGRRGISAWFNYSWQDDPISDGVAMRERIDFVRRENEADLDLDGDGVIGDTNAFVNIPAPQRLAVGFRMDRARWFASATWDFVDETFWQDVGTEEYWGWVPSYNLVGVQGGWRWPGAGLQLTAQVTNLLDEGIQQHIVGDVIARRGMLSLSYAWSGPRGGE